jgi:lipid II:glycine glycyltransferase (peptidoglycan interpeptide bridge formation enzyme)
MSYTVSTPTPSQWDAFVRAHPRAHLLQLSAWADLKSAYGWGTQRVALESNGQIVAGAQVLLRRLPWGLGTVAYCPFGPLTNWSDSALVSATLQAVETLARQNRALFLKLEPGFDVPTPILTDFGYHPGKTVQPPNTIQLSLDSEEALLGRMNQGTRRNIRKSEKFEVQVTQERRGALDDFNAMLDETGQRQGFGVHVPAYYGRAFDLFTPSDEAALWMARYQGQALAGVFAFKVGTQAWYLYGASSQAERQRMAAFGAQWAAIRWALQAGCTTYDLYGIPDESEAALEAQFESRDDGLWGVYRFKRGWGGQVRRTVGAWDQVYNRPLYWLYQRYVAWRGGVSE